MVPVPAPAPRSRRPAKPAPPPGPSLPPAAAVALALAILLPVAVDFPATPAFGAEGGGKAPEAGGKGTGDGAGTGADPTRREGPLLRIMFTAETHGALFPCDCPLAKMGGAARRATIINRIRERGDVLLLDGGGWAAGGIYDPETAGERLDRMRSIAALKAMALMRYDASAVGDEEMDPLLLRALDGTGLKPPEFLAWNWKCPDYNSRVILRRSYGEIKVAVFGLTTSEARMLWRDRPEEHTAVSDPVAAAREALGEIARSGGADLVVLLSHLGETESEKLARQVPGIDLILTGHRKTTQRAAFQAGDTLIVNFEYQARRLVVVHVLPAAVPAPQGATPSLGSGSHAGARTGSPAGGESGGAGRKFTLRVVTEPVSETTPEDPDVAKVLAELKEAMRQSGARQTVEVEIFKMPFCPSCRLLERDAMEMAGRLGDRVRFRFRYVIWRDEKGGLRSSGGPRELEEAKVQLAIARHYPEKFFEYLKWRAANMDRPWKEGVQAIGAIAARIRGVVETGEGLELLEEQALLTERRQVSAAPTVFVQNRLYDGPLEKLRILREICAAMSAPKPSECNTVPSCFSDRDCFRRGFVGRCANAGQPNAECIYSPAVPVRTAVLRDFGAVYSNHERIVESLYTFLPGLQPCDVDAGSDEGRRLLVEYAPPRLPAYLLAPEAEKEKSFFEIQSGCRRTKDRLVFSGAAAAGSHQIAGRERIRGRADLFVAPLSKRGSEALAACLDYIAGMKRPPDLRFHYVLYRTEKGETAAPGGLAEVEEAARGLAVSLKAPDRFVEYLRRRNERPGSGYWDVPLAVMGLDPAEIRAMAEDDPARGKRIHPDVRRLMDAEADLLRAIDAGGEIVLLGENCEVLPVPNRGALADFLEIIGSRRPESAR
ncbi:MAG: hypothetical protein N3A38_07100 [Planctomycetota bacterium]|nr:hypothetical protein [Planctomycetota bacterium]